MRALERAIKIIGTSTEVAAEFGFSSPMAISQWRNRGIPIDRVLRLAEMTGYEVTPHELAPEHYPHPDDGLPVEKRGAAA